MHRGLPGPVRLAQVDRMRGRLGLRAAGEFLRLERHVLPRNAGGNPREVAAGVPRPDPWCCLSLLVLPAHPRQLASKYDIRMIEVFQSSRVRGPGGMRMRGWLGHRASAIAVEMPIQDLDDLVRLVGEIEVTAREHLQVEPAGGVPGPRAGLFYGRLGVTVAGQGGYRALHRDLLSAACPGSRNSPCVPAR